MKRLKRTGLIAGGAVLALGLLVVIGLRINPTPFPAYPARTPPLQTVPLPAGLPEPVDRFYRTVYGDQIPVIESAVLTGTAELRPMGFTMPGRFRFTHDAGKAYRHYIEATLWGLPVMRINERYTDDIGLMELPFATVEDEPKTNAAANLGLWGEGTPPRTREPSPDTNRAPRRGRVPPDGEAILGPSRQPALKTRLGIRPIPLIGRVRPQLSQAFVQHELLRVGDRQLVR